MCGIVAYIGNRPVVDILTDGLRRLEYRGYDSAGVALVGKNSLRLLRSVGKVKNLVDKINKDWPDHASICGAGIAHTRWATHGAPVEKNAHPHTDEKKNFAVVHNGIIENYAPLRENLIKKGHVFTSETDTEVIPHLVEECFEGDFIKAVTAALKQLDGTFGITVISPLFPDTMIVARRGSPIVIGVCENEAIVASDVSAIIAYTKQVIYLNDNDIAVVKADSIDLRNIDNVPVSREISHINWDTGAAEKGGYEHFMLKEIFEQPQAVANTLRGRLDENDATAVLNGLNLTPREIASVSRITIAACGTSLNAGMLGDYLFEDLADLPTEYEQAAEFRYRNPIIQPGSLIIAISQSGETADTLAAVREAKNKGASVVAICNVVGSTIARESGAGIYLHAGPEIGVASTKAFSCQVAALLMMALKFGRARRLSRQEGLDIIHELNKLPELIQEVLKTSRHIEKVAKKYSRAENFFFIGRGYMYPAALEGALKLKEISYVHAEGYHAAELKHGPIALLEEKVPVLALANDIPGKDKIIGNIQECRARKSPVIAISTTGDGEIKNHANDVIEVPRASIFLTPVLSVIAMQLLSYYVAKERGCSIDQPRNLAKSVTVE